jgi:trimeric autotransporter adhesin
MRRFVLVAALVGCRQVLGIPGEGQLDDTIPGFDVTVVASGVVGASATVGIDLVRSDRSSEHVDLIADGSRTFEVADGLGYTITGPSICALENASGTIVGGPAPLDVNVTCDGIAALETPGFSAPLSLAFASSGSAFAMQGSFLVQETGLTPIPRSVGASLVVQLDGAIQTGTNGTWRPMPFTAGASIAVTSSYPPFVRPYTFTMTDAVPASFGYGKPAAPRAGSRFGSALAADRDLLVVGAPGPADQSAPGRAYVFRRTGTTWVEEAVLQAPSPMNGDNFGASVAVRDERIVVGAPRAGSVAGSAYVFVPAAAATWAGVAVTPPAGDGYGLGAAVAFDVEHILVGAPRANSSTGAVYQYSLDGTSPQNFGVGLDAGDQFGASIAAQNGAVVIGAPGEASSGSSPADNSYVGAGAAYVYTGGLGTTPAYLKAPTPAPAAGDAFGLATATNGDIVVVGAPYQDSSSPVSTGIDPIGMITGGAPQSGAVYMWRRNGSVWTALHTVKAPNTGAGDGFGSSLSFVRNVLAIGAPFEDSGSSELSAANELRRDAGAVYAYRLILGDVTATPTYIKAATPGVDDAFGSAASLSLESLVVGSPYDNSAASGWNGTGGDVGADTGAIATYR